MRATKEFYDEMKAKAIRNIQACQFENEDEFVCVVDIKNTSVVSNAIAASKRFLKAVSYNLLNPQE